MIKRLALIGSTGSVGRQTLAAARRLGIEVVALTAHTNAALLQRQITEFKPALACLTGGGSVDVPRGTEFYSGEDGVVRAAEVDCDLVFVAVSGFAGLKAVVAALGRGKNVALANKEALVCGGELVTSIARRTGAEIIPVDSEHSALWQSLGLKKQGFERLILTASGGPFLRTPAEKMKDITPSDALRHPNWKMGAKITIDCATMLNKGFEVIEAHHMFGANLSRIDVVVHPQSIVHSLVEFKDGSVIAQMSYPDMALPIQLALTYPDRLETGIPRLDLAKVGSLTFEELDRRRFPCFDLALDCLKEGGSLPCFLNGASETAVKAFLDGEMGFCDIFAVINAAVDRAERLGTSLEELTEADARSRIIAREIIERR